MKKFLLSVAALSLVGCGSSQIMLPEGVDGKVNDTEVTGPGCVEVGYSVWGLFGDNAAKVDVGEKSKTVDVGDKDYYLVGVDSEGEVTVEESDKATYDKICEAPDLNG